MLSILSCENILYTFKLSIAQRSVGPILSDQTSCCAVAWMNLSSIWMNLLLILHLQGEQCRALASNALFALPLIFYWPHKPICQLVANGLGLRDLDLAVHKGLSGHTHWGCRPSLVKLQHTGHASIKSSPAQLDHSSNPALCNLTW